MDKIDLIDQYLQGLLTKEETESFELKLKEDKDLQSEVQIRRHIILAAGESVLVDKKKMLANYEKNLSEGLNTDPGNVPPTGQTAKTLNIQAYKILGIAAMIAVVCSLCWVSMDHMSSFDKKYAQYFKPYPSHVSITRSGESTTVDAQTTKAHALYQNERYAEAAPLFEELYTLKNDTLSLFYAGVSYLGAKDQENAKRIFEKPINWNINSLYLEQIENILK